MTNDQSAQYCGCDEGAQHLCEEHSQPHIPSGSGGWIGVDLDGTLVIYPHSFPKIGPPIHAMINRVRGWLAEGKDVRIFTARVGVVPGLRSEHGAADLTFAEDQQERIRVWSGLTFGCVLPSTALKDFHMVELWDDRCVQMVTNTGEALQEAVIAKWAQYDARIAELTAQVSQLQTDRVDGEPL
jgi:hypothetical protein